MGISGALLLGVGGGSLETFEADLSGDLDDLVDDLKGRFSCGRDREGVSKSLFLPGMFLGVSGKADGRRGVPFMACCGCQSYAVAAL